MADNELVIKVKVDGKDAEFSFQNLGAQVEDTEKKATSLGTAFQVAVGNLISGAVQKALGWMQQMPGALNDIINRGAAIGDVSETFQGLAASANQTADAFLGNLKEATANTISDFDLMKRANEALRAGLTTEEFEKATQAARVLSEQTGGDLKESIDTVTQALITGRTMTLQNAFGVIDLGKAQDDLAKKLGTTKDVLTEEGQIQAARTAILEAGTKATEKFGKFTVDAGDNLAQMATTLQNAKDKFSEAAATNDNLNKSLQMLGKFIAEVDFTPLIDGFAFVTKNVTEAAEALQYLPQVFNAVKRSFYELRDPTEILNEEFQHLFQDNLNAARQNLNETSRIITNVFATSAKISAVQFQQLSKRVEELKKQLVSTKTPTEVYTKTLADIEAKLKSLGQNVIVTTTKNLEKNTAGLVDNEKAAKKAKESADKLAEAAKKQAKEWADNRDNMLSWGDYVGYVLTDAEQKALDAAAAFNELTDGQTQLAKEMTKLFGGGKIANEISLSLEGTFADILGTAFNGGKSEDYRKIFANLGGAIGSQFGPIGQVLGTVLFDAVFSIFDKPDSPGTKARKSIDKYFADAFDANRLSVVVNEQIRNIKDLDFSGKDFGDPEKGFFNVFSTLPDQARAAFLGVAQAFTELTGNSQAFAGNIAAALTNNIGGALNNLQLLIQASGVSAQELQDQLLHAFLDGELSALEAQSAINGIAQTMQVGIPDGIGQTIQAFHNLENAGVKGGRASTDALRDLGAEAKELSITNIPALMAQLQSTGEFTAEEIKQVFDALAAQGIDTIDELTNATDAQLLAVLSQLQAIKFPFKEAAADAQELIDKVADLPNEIRTKVKVDVEVNASAQDRETLSKALPNSANFVGQSDQGIR